MRDILDVDSDELLKIVEESSVVVLVWIRSCNACARFKGVFNQLPSVMRGVVFLRMNQLGTIKNLRLSEDRGMNETPSTFVYCNGEYVDMMVGFHPPDESVKILENILGKGGC